MDDWLRAKDFLKSFIAGDIFDVDNALLTDSDKLAELSKVLKGIRSREGVYAVAGNHDPQVDNQIFRVFLENSHIRLLDNDVAELSCISLVGRTDASNNRREPLTELLNRCSGGKAIVIADHDPQGIREAVSYQADLVLCGHTHRGQFFPVTLFTKWANGKHYFYGHQVFGDTHAVISSGAGFFQLPVRIGTNNEIADICLKL